VSAARGLGRPGATARLDHIGIVVASFAGVETVFGDVLGLELTGPEYVAELEMDILWVSLGETRLQFIRPARGDTRAAAVLRDRGPGIHHLGVEVADLEGALEQLRNHGVALLDPVPRAGARGSRVAFVDPAAVAGAAVELVQDAS
jgi:methylmalonyl-CoA/ethylmalonyl-CoA epimerase